MPVFKDAEEIYQDLRADLDAAGYASVNGPLITGVLKVIAAALSLAYTAAEWVYWNIFPHTADVWGLQRWYEAWGLLWDNPDEDTARKTVLAQFRTRGTGSASWYRQVVMDQFQDVVNVEVRSGNRGPGTVSLYVFASPISQTLLDQIENLFRQDQYNIAGIDVKVFPADTLPFKP